MKRLIRIIFLLVLIQYIIAESCEKKGGVCVGEYLDPKYLCVESGDTCEKKLLCESVGKEGSDPIDCSNYPVKTENKKTHTCSANPSTEEENSPCKEILKLCSEMTEKDVTDEECRKHPVYESNAPKDGYICVAKSEGGCEEKPLCPTTEGSLKDGECSDYASSDSKKVCRVVKEKEKTCTEVFLCEKATSGENDDQCSIYIAKDEYVCQKNNEGSAPSDPPCKEVHTCNFADKDGKELSAEVCSKYPISLENKNTHACLYNEEDKKCYEQILCEKAKKEGDEQIVCSNYPVATEKKNTHGCVTNPSTDEGSTPCIEKDFCSKITDGTLTEELCKAYPISNRENKEDYICVLKSEGGGCEEKLSWEKVTELGENEKCSDYPSSTENKVCTEGESTKCKEEFLCGKDESTKELTDSICNKYPVSKELKDTHICSYN